MTEPRTAWTDERVERLLGNLLRAGVLLAAAVVLAGGALYLARYGTHAARGHRPFHGEPEELTSLGGIVTAAARLRRRGLIQLGLVLLIATPIARVAFSALVFLLQRDWLYVACTALVLGLLVSSLLGWG